jgi:lysozyme family protein
VAFTSALNLVLSLEGGESYNPADPGGCTKNGITQETYAALGCDGNVWAASPGEIALCYHKLWESCKIHNIEADCTMSVFDCLPEPADSVAFQMFINLPWTTFIKLLQTAVCVAADGHLGPITYRAIQKCKGHDLADRLLDLQRTHYESVAKPVFLNGLLNRVDRVDKWLADK